MSKIAPDRFQDIRDAVRSLCAAFPDEYHRDTDTRRAYPEQFVDALTEAGWLAALVPQDYGGSGLGLAEASVIREEINRSGGNAGAGHGQMYNMGTLIAAECIGDGYWFIDRVTKYAGERVVFGRPIGQNQGVQFPIAEAHIEVEAADLMILLARTTALADVGKKTEGMSIFVVDLRDAIGKGLDVRPIPNMVNHETNELFFENLEIPAENLIGEEGRGFKYILDGLNAERTLIAAECIGDGYWFIDRVSKYVKERIVFGRPIGQNQGVQFPIAESYIEVEAANLMRWKACELFDARQPCGAEANMAKYLAAKASWEAANACIQFHGGFGFANEYDVERKFRETRLYQVAPISTNLILSYVAEHLLGLPRSF